MKKVLLIILVIFVLGCTEQAEIKEEENGFFSKFSIVMKEKSTPKISSTDVRLTSKGFDADSVNVPIDEFLSIYISDDNVNGNYLTIEGERIAKKELSKMDRVDVEFEEKGVHKITDETSKSELIVNVV